MTIQKNSPSSSGNAPRRVDAKKNEVSQPSHPLIQKAMRDTGYLVWTNIGC